MDNKNNFRNDDGKKENTPLEIPENAPAGEQKPIRNKKVSKVKAAYAFALILALGAAFTAKIASENALGKLQVPLESDYVTITEVEETSKDKAYLTTEPDYEVRQNLTNVIDERKESTEPETQEKTTELTIQKGLYAQPYKDYYVLPMGTDIHKDYSPDTPSYNATMGDWRTHNGIDFKGAEGDQVKSIAYGTVKNIYDDALLGTVAEIDHGNGVMAKYCGLNKDTLEIKQGGTVKGGTLLGYLGVVPCEKTDVSHLHFEVYYNGKNVDPLELMGK